MKNVYKIIFRFLLISVLHPLTSFSQIAPGIEWSKTFGGTEIDEPHAVVQTYDGGYAAIGFTNSDDGDVTVNYGNLDFWVVRLDSSGNLLWQRSYGGTQTDEGLSMSVTSDSGFIIAGNTFSNDSDVTNNCGSCDFWVVKLDSAGNIQWQKALGGSGWDGTNSVLQTTDGGYIAAGETISNDSDVTGNHGGYDMWVVKLDNGGSIQWQKCLGGTGDDQAESIKQTNDGGYVAVGESTSDDGDLTGNNGNFDCWIVKLDSTGSIQWQTSLGGSNLDFAYGVVQSTDGNYMVTSHTFSNDSDVTGNHGASDFWVIKLDSSGSMQWQKCFGGTNNDQSESIVQATDGNFVITGFTSSDNGDVTSNYGNQDAWVLKIDSAGTIQWQKTYGGSDQDWPFSIIQTTDEGYVFAARSHSNDYDVNGNHGNGDYWIAKLRPEVIDGISANHSQLITNQFFPNPLTTQSKLTFKNPSEEKFIFTLCDITDRLTESISTTSSEIILTKGSKQPGVYLFNLVNEKNGERWNGKIVVSN